MEKFCNSGPRYVCRQKNIPRTKSTSRRTYKENLGNFLIDSLIANVSLDKDTEKDTIQFAKEVKEYLNLN